LGEIATVPAEEAPAPKVANFLAKTEGPLCGSSILAGGKATRARLDCRADFQPPDGSGKRRGEIGRATKMLGADKTR